MAGIAQVTGGNVQIDAGDLFVGNINNPTQICLYGAGENCIDSWGDVVSILGTLWTEDLIFDDPAGPSGDIYHTYLSKADSNLAIGGTGAERLPPITGNYETEFFFNVTQGGKFALGIPSAGTPTKVTCGDGACNTNLESNAICPQDCPVETDPNLPGNITSLTATEEAGPSVLLQWNNPGDGNFSSLIIVRRENAPPTFTPTAGTSYGAGEIFGSDVIVYSSSGSFHTDWIPPINSGSTYHYHAFARNSAAKYSDGFNDGSKASLTIN